MHRIRNYHRGNRTSLTASKNNEVTVDEVFQPLHFEAPIHTLQTRVQTYGTNVDLTDAWYELESVVENGTTSAGETCNSNLTQQSDHPFRITDDQMWYSTFKENGSTVTTTYWNGTLSLKPGKLLTSREGCSNYQLTVGFYANATIQSKDRMGINTTSYRSCDHVPSDGVYLIDPFGDRDNNTSFWTRCKDGFTEITQDIARRFLNATLKGSGNIVDSVLIDGKRPYTVDGGEGHFAHYDIPIPFRYTQFYLEEFHIRAMSYKVDGGDTSESGGKKMLTKCVRIFTPHGSQRETVLEDLGDA